MKFVMKFKNCRVLKGFIGLDFGFDSRLVHVKHLESNVGAVRRDEFKLHQGEAAVDQ